MNTPNLTIIKILLYFLILKVKLELKWPIHFCSNLGYLWALMGGVLSAFIRYYPTLTHPWVGSYLDG